MNNEVGRISHKAAVTEMKHYTRTCLEGLGATTKIERWVSIRHFPNTNQASYGHQQTLLMLKTTAVLSAIPCSKELQRAAYSNSTSRYLPPFVQPGNSLPFSPDRANSCPDNNAVKSLSIKLFIPDTNKCTFYHTNTL